MDNMHKARGVSYQEILSYLAEIGALIRDQQTSWKGVYGTDRYRESPFTHILTMNEKSYLSLMEKFGEPLETARERRAEAMFDGGFYRAEYVPHSLEAILSIDGEVRLVNGRIIEDTHLNYIVPSSGDRR